MDHPVAQTGRIPAFHLSIGPRLSARVHQEETNTILSLFVLFIAYCLKKLEMTPLSNLRSHTWIWLALVLEQISKTNLIYYTLCEGNDKQQNPLLSDSVLSSVFLQHLLLTFTQSNFGWEASWLSVSEYLPVFLCKTLGSRSSDISCLLNLWFYSGLSNTKTFMEKINKMWSIYDIQNAMCNL